MTNNNQYEIERSRIRAVFVTAEQDDLEALQNLEHELQGILDYRDGKGASAIHAACRAGSVRTLKWMLETRPELATQFDKEGRSPLHAACLARDGEKCVEVLLEFYETRLPERQDAGETVGFKNTPLTKKQILDAKQVDEGATALHLACCVSVSSTRALLVHGADANADSAAGRPLLWCVSHTQDPEEELALVKLLIDHGADVNSAAKFNNISPLIVTCMRGDGHVGVSKALIQFGADIRLRVQNLSPLHAACAVGAIQTVQVLLEKAAKQEEGGEEGMMAMLKMKDLQEHLYPIEHAAYAHQDAIVDYLLPWCRSFLPSTTRDELIARTTAKVAEEERIIRDLEKRAGGVKEEGNSAFKAGHFEQAIDKYREALMLEMEVEVKDDEDETKTGKRAPVSTYNITMGTAAILHSNVAACYLKLNKIQDALEAAKAAVECDPKSTKALFRLGTCYSKLGDHEAAAKAFWDGYSVEKGREGGGASGEMFALFNEEIQAGRRKLEGEGGMR